MNKVFEIMGWTAYQWGFAIDWMKKTGAQVPAPSLAHGLDVMAEWGAKQGGQPPDAPRLLLVDVLGREVEQRQHPSVDAVRWVNALTRDACGL